MKIRVHYTDNNGRKTSYEDFYINAEDVIIDRIECSKKVETTQTEVFYASN